MIGYCFRLPPSAFRLPRSAFHNIISLSFTCLRQCLGQNPRRPRGMGLRCPEDGPERKGDQGVSCKNRHGASELRMDRRLAATEL